MKLVFFSHIDRHIGRHLGNGWFVVVEFSFFEFLDPKNIGFDTLFLMVALLQLDKLIKYVGVQLDPISVRDVAKNVSGDAVTAG